MPNIGPLELAIVAIIALIVFGPKKLPELGSSLGKGMREFKASISGESKDDDDGPLHVESDAEEATEDIGPTDVDEAEEDLEKQAATGAGTPS